MSLSNPKQVNSLDDIKYEGVDNRSDNTKKGVGVIARLALSGWMIIAPVLYGSCSEAKKPIKPAATISQTCSDYQLENNIYNLVKDITEKNKPSDLIVSRDDNSVTYCSKGINDLVRMLENGGINISEDLFKSEGFYIKLKSTRDEPNNFSLEFVYFNNPEFKGDVVFGFEMSGGNSETIMGIEKGRIISYRKNKKETNRILWDPKLGATSDAIVNQTTTQRYIELAKTIQKNYK